MIINELQFLGKRYGEEKERIFQNSDIFVFPTYYECECFPLVLLEAMQYGLPCVTTDEGGIRDIVENGRNGFVCPRQDAMAVADALDTLINDSELRTTMGKEGRKKLMKLFTESVFEERLKEIFEETIQHY